MFRTFPQYRPRQIAYYVKGFFKGSLYIQGVGAFQFDCGRLLLPSLEDKRALHVMKEVNQEIKAISFI